MTVQQGWTWRASLTGGDGFRRQPINYEVPRAVFRDDSLSLKDVQTILGHAHLSTTSERVAAKIGSAEPMARSREP
jgi:hypothetical protein